MNKEEKIKYTAELMNEVENIKLQNVNIYNSLNEMRKKDLDFDRAFKSTMMITEYTDEAFFELQDIIDTLENE